MTDPEAATVREWTDVLARIRFGTIKVAGKTITGARIKLVGGRLANYADSDGTRVRPGIPRLAVDLETDYRTAKNAVAVLRRVGLLKLVKAGARPGHADEYRLTIPADLLECPDIEVWSLARHALEMERVREATRGKYRRSSNPDDLRGRLAPADAETCRGQTPPQESDLQGPDAPADTPHPAEPAGASGTAETRPAGASGTNLQGPQAPATDHGPRHNYDLPRAEEVRTALTGPRATRPEEPPSDVVDEPAPDRCEHGNPPTRRPDGRLHCIACRVFEDRAAGRRPLAAALPSRPTR